MPRLFADRSEQLSVDRNHSRLFGGIVRYVNATSGDDNNSGLTPDTPFATIAAAITASAAGDAISVKQGTYDEAGLDLNLAGLELWLEAGAILQDSGDGDVLTISAFGCRVVGSGNVRIDPTGGATGVVISGGFVEVKNIRVNANSAGAIGFDITGDGAELWDCRCSNPTTAAFKIQGDKVKLEQCCTGGAGGATIGYWITNSNDKARLIECGSQGHATASFQIDTGCTNTVIWKFSSGGGDGKWEDADSEATVNGLDYERQEFKSITFTNAGGVGGAGTNYNLFRIYGSVKVFNIFGVITTVTPATNSTANLELYSTNAAVDITDSAGAPDLVSRVVGTTLAREGAAGDPLEIGEPDSTPAVIENASFNSPSVPIICIEDDAAATYVQLVLTAALASGAMRWQIEWEPVSADGFVAVA